MAWLLVLSGRDRGAYFGLEGETVVVGRDEGCDIQIIDEMVSRRHFQIRRADEKHHLDDMNSANGVKINGHRITKEVALHDRDAITIGETKLLYTEKRIRDLDTAMAIFKQRGQRDKDTVVR
jgi:pSer/pThr/pTyr-binding forkhead associated (FHA) protein